VEAEDKRKTQLIPKEDIKRIIGHSPDISDSLAMRMYYEIRDTVSPYVGIQPDIVQQQYQRVLRTRNLSKQRSTR